MKFRNSSLNTRRQLIEVRYVPFLLILLIFVILPGVLSQWNPYEILGVRKDASLDQIKKAYRELARKLHPDKSTLKEDDSGRRFIELNKAFNILKDPIKRNRFDQRGETEDNRHARGSGYQPNNRQTREYFAHDGFRTFTFFASDGHLRKKSVTARQFYTDHIKESKQRPIFIFFYSDLCPTCSMLEPAWTKITDELSKYNLNSITINVYHESRLARELGVSSVPHIACLLDSQVHPYYQSELSLSSIVKFLRNLLPTDRLMPLLSSNDEQDNFIHSSPQSNRLGALIVNTEKKLKLRYLLLAYEFRDHYKFGHVSTKLSEHALLVNQFNLSINSVFSHILIFNEELSKPRAHLVIDSDNLDMVNIRKDLSKWPFLKLPRLSSQQKFDDLCVYAIPKDGDTTRTRLCIILFAQETPSSSSARNKMIEFIELNNLSQDDRVVFSYLDPFKQSEFCYKFTIETEKVQPSFVKDSIEYSVVAIERHPGNNLKAQYKWINFKWYPKKVDELDRAKLELYQIISDYKRNSILDFEKVVLSSLRNEEGPGLLSRLFGRLFDYIQRFVHYVTTRESLTAVIMLIGTVCIATLFFYNSPNDTNLLPNNSRTMPQDFEFFGKNTSNCANNNSNDNNRHIYNNKFSNSEESLQSQADRRSTGDELKLIELKAATYYGMIRLLKPGFRSIILLTDNETRDILIPQFRKAIWPFRRNKTLLFGYLCLDKNFDWYKALLEDILSQDNLNLNKKNCIGTVLSLNGFKQYVRFYHAKHNETSQYGCDDEANIDGSFLGFDDDGEEEDNCDDVERGGGLTSRQASTSVDKLLDRLPIWLDKVFDGLTKRYFVENWPENIR